MAFGRLLGWLSMAAAILWASADAVMALGLGERATGVATAEVITLLSGYAAPDMAAAQGPTIWSVGLLLLDGPAWLVLALAGLLLCWACRRRPRRFRLRPRPGP